MPDQAGRPATPDRHLRLRPRAATVVVAAGMLAITGILMWLAWIANDRTDTSRLDLETRQVAATLSAALPSLQPQLDDALDVVAATGSPADFEQFVRRQRAGSRNPFVSESLWVRTATGTRLLANVGQPLRLRGRMASDFFGSLHPGTTMSVTGILPGSPRRLGYATALPGDEPYVVYAESLLPATTRFKIPASSPFSALDYAVYLGKDQRAADLVEASVATPITGTHAVAAVPLGDTFVTVVATPRGQLTPGTSAALPWVILGVGLALALASAEVVEHLGRRRQAAEDLSDRLGQLYAEQRGIAQTLQQALLPERLPAIDRMDIAARYLPGARGAEVGGDWYDVVPLGRDRFMFVIGDVSGRGIRAAAVMASLRFASRTLAMEGHGPATVLQQLARSLDFASDGHFATVLCGLVDVAHHSLTLANAGHLPPALRANDDTAHLYVPPAPPIGILGATDQVEPVVVHTPAGSLLVAYTDGLVERRGEPIGTSLERLTVAVDQQTGSADASLDNLLTELTESTVEDDIAMIAIRWLS